MRGPVQNAISTVYERVSGNRAADLAPLIANTDPSAALEILRASRSAVANRARATDPGTIASILAGGGVGRGLFSQSNPPQYTQTDEGAPMPLELVVGYSQAARERERKRREELAAQYGLTLAP